MGKVSRPKGDPSRDDRVIRELSAIKRLMAALLIKAGTSQTELVAALQIDRADVSRLLPARKFRPFGSRGVQNGRAQ